MLKIRIRSATGQLIELPASHGVTIEFVDTEVIERPEEAQNEFPEYADPPISEMMELEFYKTQHMKQYPKSPSLSLEDYERNIYATPDMISWLWHIMKHKAVVRDVVNQWCKELGMKRINEELRAKSYVHLIFRAMNYSRGG